ncbi:magnesium/cobalt transporter CorA [Yinghuangia soli]|uniref:Magnesium transport protein CorA n=1 Tax=Yinghuangia soli TaxID=2908204 RepID=A0AA41Q341_9ACTN|nr:magnesium/cobalt transporter CorA [Yinghuangia soli]MCF2529851.1 magnesium/cobalt transporter CorA [Yinghuangia soli]
MSMIRDLRAAVRPVMPRRAPVRTAAPDPVTGNCVVDCAVYRDGRRQHGCTAPDAAIQDVHTRGDGFVWIGLHEPSADELAGIAERFDLHPLAVEDAVKAHQRPKLERYDDTLFAVFKTVRYVEHEHLTATSEVVETGEIMVFLGRDFVITVRHGLHGGLGELRHRLEENPELLAAGPSSILHAVADRVVDTYLDVTQLLQDDIDDVENEVFGGKGNGDAGRIYQLKRELLELKRAVTPLARPLQILAERPMRQVHPDIREYFRDVEDHLARVSEQIAAFDELLTSILQANLAQVTVAQNEDMRRISAWVAIFAVPTMVAGIYGMNFEHMPELQWKYGYPTVLSVTLSVCLMIHRGFRRNGWL